MILRMSIVRIKLGKDTFECFDTPKFIAYGREYVIISTESIGRDYYTKTIDTVKNDKGEVKSFTRQRLLEFIKKGTPKSENNE